MFLPALHLTMWCQRTSGLPLLAPQWRRPIPRLSWHQVRLLSHDIAVFLPSGTAPNTMMLLRHHSGNQLCLLKTDLGVYACRTGLAWTHRREVCGRRGRLRAAGERTEGHVLHFEGVRW